jgi:hypothetical protein
MMGAGGTLEVGRSLIDANDQNLATFRATDFFLFPLLASDWMVDSDFCRTQLALEFPKTARQQAFTFWATQRRW